MSDTTDLLDRIRTAVLVLDSKFTIQYMNSAAEDFCGGSGDFFHNKPISKLLTGDFVREADLKRCLHDYGAYTLREVELFLVSTHRQAVANIAVTTMDDQQLLVEIEPLDRILLINKGHQMKDAQIANRQLIRGMAHEIKNPLGGIRGAAQLLQKERNSNDREELTEIIIDEVERLRRLVDRLLGPNHTPNFKNINIHAVLERVFKLLSQDDYIDINIQRQYDPSLPDIYGDFDQLLQALLNVSKNAQDALVAVETPTLTIQTRVEHQFTIGAKYHSVVAHITFSDNGSGIPPDLLGQIFFPLVTTKTTGTGLGLAITQSIVSAHKGLITCESKPGRTSFDIYLPFAQDPSNFRQLR